ncbi:MAG: hypothetical protein CVU06_08175 [Bacteroidetes bacterium HGW-Bacteroidetes-22]|nr:MAG: hypothetical protein CVU06_08175 [Bacteroidetes bacterium HGW-Bacteroidetes-22]
MAQNDTEFWFGAPENETNNNSRDQPIYIRVATFNSPATVTLSQPARSSFVPMITNIPANGNYTFDLSAFKSVIETQPQNQPLNYGIRLVSTAPVTAYYEQSSLSNPDIFTLKGKNALGTRFIIPSQTAYYNSQRNDLGGPKYFWFVIVATDNNTHITIVPTKAIDGHAANVPFNITLQKGQTYSCRTTGQSPAEHPAGTLVTSDKPIAVTINDDSVCQCQSCSTVGPDLVGDQLISSSIYGKEYILVKGYFTDSNFPNGPTDHVYIYADSANTVVTINGTAYSPIGQGQFIDFMFGVNNAAYLSSTKPVEVFHLSGSNAQPAGAVIPPIECTGSNEIVFTKSISGGSFGLILFTRAGNENFFTVSSPQPSNFSIPGSSFQVVPNTGGQWLYYRNNSITPQVVENNAYRVSNSAGLFHLGVLYGESSSNARYGFYSNFASLNLGPDQTICPGDSILLDAGAGKDSYFWSPGGQTTHNIWIKNPGTYSVYVTDYMCQYSDTMVLAHYPVAPINLGPDTAICTGTTITLDAGAGFSVYSWSNGGHNRTTTVGPGTYTVTASIAGSCNSMDTIIIGSQPLPTPVPIRHN